MREEGELLVAVDDASKSLASVVLSEPLDPEGTRMVIGGKKDDCDNKRKRSIQS